MMIGLHTFIGILLTIASVDYFKSAGSLADTNWMSLVSALWMTFVAIVAFSNAARRFQAELKKKN